MKRWSDLEADALSEIRRRLHHDLQTIDQNPEVVGDRKLLRFFRGHNCNIDKTIEMIKKYIGWRKSSNVDSIRRDIVHGGMNHPSRFPNGDKILSFMPQIVIDANCTDKQGFPICVEQYNFSLSALLAEITLEEYTVFVTYSLEYRSLILEQLSEKKERERVAQLKEAEAAGKDLSKEEPYGVIMYQTVIRDLLGVGFEHLGSQGQAIIQAVIGVASDNYPELMRKCHMINVPWLFNTVWWVIKGWLSPITIEKVNVLGANFHSALAADIDHHFLPACVGGKYDTPPEPFEFDICEGGLLWTPHDSSPGAGSEGMQQQMGDVDGVRGEQVQDDGSAVEASELHDM